MNLMSLTAVELGKKIKSGEITAVEATKAALEQIKKLDGTAGPECNPDRAEEDPTQRI